MYGGDCKLSNDPVYQFYATIGAFYLPLTIMIVIYYRIYMVSSRIAQAEAKSKPNGLDAAKLHCVTYTSQEARLKSDSPIKEHRTSKKKCSSVSFISQKFKSANGCSGSGKELYDLQLTARSTNTTSPSKGFKKNKHPVAKSPKASALQSNECKATRTLGIIMGAFTACWLPFFILALVRSFCGGAQCIPHWLSSLFLWLGYANSFFNPIIYARFNREFRTPFKDILLLRCRGINLRLRTESYAEQFGGGGSRCVERKPPLSKRHVGEEDAIDTVVQYHSGQGRTVIRLEDRFDGANSPVDFVKDHSEDKSGKDINGEAV